MSEVIANLNQKQRERLAFIEFRLWFLGDVRRQDLIDRFGIAGAGATRDIALYREITPANIRFIGTTKLYAITDTFKPVFEHQPERVLSALSRGFGDADEAGASGYLPCEFPMRLNQPPLQLLAPVSRAIHQRKALSLNYHSLSSGVSQREIVPFALVDSGLRWHVRCFDRKSQEFRDLVISRMEKPAILEDAVIQDFEQQENDHQWTRMVTLELVPHPDQDRPEIIARDFGMQDGRLLLNVRAGVAGYVLQQWSVDCSASHSLDPKRHRLWLKAANYVLHGVSSAVLAPGYAGTP
jgi:hypothetical protein